MSRRRDGKSSKKYGPRAKKEKESKKRPRSPKKPAPYQPPLKKKKLRYNPPSWAIDPGESEIQFKFEVSKRGTYIKQIRLFEEDPYVALGRDPSCHIQLLHDSVSRNHAIIIVGTKPVYEKDLQKGKQLEIRGDHEKNGKKGKIVMVQGSKLTLRLEDEVGLVEVDFDCVVGLEKICIMDFSSHGVYVNSERIPKKQWTEVNEGDKIVFGESSRSYNLKTGKKKLIAEILEDPDAFALVPVKKKKVKVEHIPTEKEVEAQRKRKLKKLARKLEDEEAVALDNEKYEEIQKLQSKLVTLLDRLEDPHEYLQTIPEVERSPSPTPMYDGRGKRVNGRLTRLKKRLYTERDDYILNLLDLNPNFRPPPGWKRPTVTRKLEVPVKSRPGFNWVSHLLGPGGTTMMRLQKETHCKVSLRGKGSFKSKGQKHRVQSHDNEPMHIFISGKKKEFVEAATVQIELLFRLAVDWSGAQAQRLRMMAYDGKAAALSVNTCKICGKGNHPVWSCPERPGQDWAPAMVQCAICGELSHLTADCIKAKRLSKEKRQKLAKQLGAGDNQNKMMDDYAAFVSTLKDAGEDLANERVISHSGKLELQNR